MRKTFLSISLLLTTFLTSWSSDFDRAVNLLVNNNLEAKVAAGRGRGEIESMKAENTLEGPEAEFSRVWGTNPEVGNKMAFSISQGFDWPGLYAARKRAVKTAESALEFLRASTMLETRRDARTLLIDYIHNAQLLKVQSRYAIRLDSMEAYYRKAAEEGLETRLDYNKTVIERIGVHRDLHQLERDRDALLVRIRAFNGGESPEEVIRLVGDSYPSVDREKVLAAISGIEERDPGYAAARLQAESARQRVRVEKLSGLPGFSVGFEHETELGGGFNGFSVGIKLPTWSRRHSKRAAVIEAELAEKDAEIMLRGRKADFESDFVKLDYYEQAISEYAQVVEDPSMSELLRKALIARQITLLNYMDEENYFNQARKEYIDLLYEYHQTLSHLMYYE